MPMFKYQGGLVAFAAFKEHCSLFVMSRAVMEAHESALKGYDTARGTVRFAPDKPLPAALVRNSGRRGWPRTRRLRRDELSEDETVGRPRDGERRRRTVAGRSEAGLYPTIEPYQHGALAAGEGNLVYWETCGNPRGKPAVVLHGGPGSGCTAWHRRLFDPAAYRVVLFDQRGCGRSTPHASGPDIDLASNTTHHLIADVELLRERLEVERWLVLGGSWGSTLALAYAERHPERVSELVLFGVTTGRRPEFDWLFRGGVAAFFPEQWERLCAALPAAERDGDVVDAYHRLLHDPDPEVRQRAALEWCMWESATPAWPPAYGVAPRFKDPAFALAFARLVTHYVRHDAWLEDGSLLRDAGSLAGILGVMVNGRFDFQAPIGNAWALKRAWPQAELVIVDDAGHAAEHPGITRELVRATARFAGR